MGAEPQKPPPGVVGIMTGPDGHVWATVTDFHADGYGGYTLAEAQEHRARNALRIEFAHRCCSEAFANAIDSYIADQIIKRMKGFKETFIRIGHADD